MKHSGLDFLRLSGIPEILAQVTEGYSGHVHLVLVLIMTLRAFPLHVLIDDDLTVEAARCV